MDNGKRKQSLSKITPIGLFDLPRVPLYTIFSKLQTNKALMLRKTSRKVEVLHTTYVMYQYQLSVNLVMRAKDECSSRKLQKSRLQVLDDATKLYINAGYENEFASAIWTYSNKFLTANEVFKNDNLWTVLRSFYSYVESSSHRLSNSNIVHRRLLLMMTLLNLAKQFRGFHLEEFIIDDKVCYFIFEVVGPTLGLYVRLIRDADFNRLLEVTIVMAEMLTYDLCGEAKYGNKVFKNNSYEYNLQEPTTTNRCPKMRFEFTVEGSSTVFDKLKEVINCTEDISSDFDFKSQVSKIGIGMQVRGGWCLWNGSKRIYLQLV